ncbi:MAG: mycothiol conjugate amidase Mca [Propionibacteriaceae bacterium]|nr:mycothiol conjugate amidase Mca [Propionibacteriaceae bacterium]
MFQEPLRLLCAHAHPDDEASKGAATMAMYVRHGFEVTVLTMTGGERGDVLNPKLDNEETRANLAEIRRTEMDRAREILGVRQVWLGYEDSGFTLEEPWEDMPEGSLAATDLRESAAKMADLLVELRPHVLITYDENGGYPHPDHIMCHKVSIKALAYAADKERYGERSWEVPKVYYHMSFHREKYLALGQAMRLAGLESPYIERLQGWVYDAADHRITTKVTCSDFFEVRDDALRAHATQVDPDGWWFVVPLEIQKETWPTEDYELARSTIPVKLPETDLFAGLR